MVQVNNVGAQWASPVVHPRDNVTYFVFSSLASLEASPNIFLPVPLELFHVRKKTRGSLSNVLAVLSKVEQNSP